MEQQLGTIEGKIAFLYDSKDKEDIKTKTEIVIDQIRGVYDGTRELRMGNKMFTLVIVLKYYLVTIQEYKKAYELFRDVLDRRYNSLLHPDYREDYVLLNKEYRVDEIPADYNELIKYLELICAMKIGTISGPLKEMNIMNDYVTYIDLDKKYYIKNMEFRLGNLGSEFAETYGHFIIYLIKNDNIEKEKIIDMLFIYLETCNEELYSYEKIIPHYYILRDIRKLHIENEFSEFYLNIVYFYSILFGYNAKRDLKDTFNTNENEFKKEYRRHQDVFELCDVRNVESSFKDFFFSIDDEEVEIYDEKFMEGSIDYQLGYYVDVCIDLSRQISSAIDRYFYIWFDAETGYKTEILNKISELKKLEVSKYKMRFLYQYVFVLFEDTIHDWFEAKQYKAITEIYNLLSNGEEYYEEYYEEYSIEDFYFELAYSFSEIGERQTAKKLYQNAIDNGSENSQVYSNLAELYAKEGYNEKALDLYRKAYEISNRDI